MEHEVLADVDGVIRELAVAVGEAVSEGQLLATLEPRAVVGAGGRGTEEPEREGERADLRAVRERHEIGLDAARREAVARRHEHGRRTARENLAELVDAGTFVEYGPLLFAAQERRRTREELIARTPADGLVGGVGDVEGHPCVVMSYDYTVLAGTQGMRNHAKKDRLFELAERRRLPVVLFAEGGGGRPGDVDMPIVAGLDCRAFALFASLSGLVPLVGVAGGYCFAGNAALLGCCDVVIATEDSSIGMGGPAMIEGGGLGVHHPSEVGPIDVQYANGVVDLRAADEREAVALAKRYLSYFYGPRRARRAARPGAAARRWSPSSASAAMTSAPSCEDAVRRGLGARAARRLGPGDGHRAGPPGGPPAGRDRQRRPPTSAGRSTPRPPTRPPASCSCATPSSCPCCSSATRPASWSGPAAERTATVRHFARMFLAGANVSVPIGTIVLRKGYGLGAQAMAAGGFKAPLFTVAWPTSEFGAMGLEGAVRLGMRRELEAIEDPDERERVFERDGGRRLRAGPRPEHGRLRRDRRRHRPGRLAPLDRHPVRRARPARGGSAPARSAPTSTPGRARGARRGISRRLRPGRGGLTRRRRIPLANARNGGIIPLRGGHRSSSGVDLEDRMQDPTLKSRRYPPRNWTKPMSHPTPDQRLPDEDAAHRLRAADGARSGAPGRPLDRSGPHDGRPPRRPPLAAGAGP